MDKRKTLIQALVLSLVLVCGICIGAGASGTAKTITALIDPDVTITLDGVPQEFFDSKGERVFPILYNGSTYLPMRAVCQDMAGFKVDWDQATRTASVSTKNVDGVDLLDMQRAYYLTNADHEHAYHYMSSDKQTKEINGYELTHWLECTLQYSAEGQFSQGSFNLDGKYDTVTFRYYSDQDAILEVIGDNDSVLWRKELKGGALYQEITVDLLKTNQLTFKFTATKTTPYFDGLNGYIYDVRLK